MAIITLNAEEIRGAVTMREAIDAVASALVDVGDGSFEQPIRTVMNDGGFLVMPIHHRPSATAMVKTLSLSFDREPAIAGTVCWVDLHSSDSIVADAGIITAIRTGAIAGLATSLLAPPQAHCMAMVGAGGQSADQIRGVQAVRPLSQLRIFDLNPSKSAALAERMRTEWPGTDIVVSDRIDAAVREADIISCATTSRQPVLQAEMLPDEVHINAIGAFRPSMREVPDEVLQRATVFVEDMDAVLQESGEILHAIDHGCLSVHDITELRCVIRDGAPRRTGWTVFKTVGIAAQDWAVADLLSRRMSQLSQLAPGH